MNVNETRLTKFVIEEFCDAENRKRVLKEIRNPDWFAADDWVTFIPSDIRDLWPRLSNETKLVAHLVARASARKTNYAD